MLTREDDIDVHALRRQGWTISAIARHLGHDRKAIRAYLNGRQAGVRAPAGPDEFAPFIDYCRAWLTEDPHLWAMTLHRNVGHSIHGLARRNDELFWISTGTHEIRSDKGYCYRLQREGFARGFAMSESYFIIGASEAVPRRERHRGNSLIQLIDRSRGVVVSEVPLQGTGAINDLRLLDEYDYAHGIKPFMTES